MERARSYFFFFFILLALLCGACGQKADRESPQQAAPVTANQNLPKIIAFGNSLTAGLGLQADETYPAQLQKILQADGYKYEVVNAGVSGDTSSGGLRRLDWSIDGNVKFVILELGANDMLRGIETSLTKKNLSTIIERIQARRAKVVLVGMEAPTSSGPDYRKEIHEMYQELSKQHPVLFIPFFFQDLLSSPEKYFQSDGSHPNPAGAQILARTVYKVLKPHL